jgi:type I restriction enzyme M protein
VLCRLECVLEPTRDKVRSQYEAMEASDMDTIASVRWKNARFLYDVHKFTDGKPETKAP